MKILYAVDYYQPQIGYSEFFLPRELSKLGHTVTILTSNYYYPFPNYKETAGKILGDRQQPAGTFRQGKIKVIKEPLRAEIFTRAIIANHAKYLDQIKPDLVIVNKTAGWNAIRLAMLKKKYGYELITYDAHLPSGFHATGNLFAKKVFYTIFRLLFANLLNTQGDAHVAVQEKTVDIMRDYYGIKDITYIPLGTDVERFHRDPSLGRSIRKKFGIPRAAFVLIYTGKIVETKGVDILCRSFGELAGKFPMLHLLLVGSGAPEYTQKCLSYIKPHYHDRLHWAGFQNNEELYKYYSAADLGVWPLEESTAMNDAMACKLPFIANHTLGARRKLANDNALLYRRGNAHDLARQIRTLMQDRKRAKAMGARGKELIDRELNWSVIAKQYLNLTHIKHLHATLNWLKRAQDVTSDHGVSAYYSLLFGWAPSFIETTGYIIPTFLRASQLLRDPDLYKRALKMGDFLLKMQLKSGGFRTYVPGSKRSSDPTIFNTGQDILGLIDLYMASGKSQYLASARRAADFLVQEIQPNGTWITYTDNNLPRAYHSRVAYALLKVYEITHNQNYRTAATKHLNWVLSQQSSNGWFAQTELIGGPSTYPITHTMLYVVEGLFYSGQILGQKKYQTAAIRMLKPLARSYQKTDRLAPSFDKFWQPHGSYAIPTGEAQLAALLLDIARSNRDPDFLTCTSTLISRLKKSQPQTGYSHGAIAGSRPLYGDIFHLDGYCRLAYINWGAKFFADALMNSLH